MFVQISRLLNERVMSPWRWEYLVKHLSPYLSNSQKILDVGAGDGGLSNELLKQLHNIDITGVDVYPQTKTFLPIIHQYNGKVLPFPDNTFDTVMIIDVLHHDKHPERILREARRVSKRLVLIKDHYWTNVFDFSLLKWAEDSGTEHV